jgi:hypothetical protein
MNKEIAKQFRNVFTTVIVLVLGMGIQQCDGKESSNPRSEETAITYTYPEPVYKVDMEISPNKPTNEKELSNFVIEPELPEGLTLDVETGILTGTPRDARPQELYTITADLKNEESMQGTLLLQVDLEHSEGPPKDCHYSKVIMVKGNVLDPVYPNMESGAYPMSFTLSEGSLPNGLALDEASGQISGIPTESTEDVVTYKFSAENEFGSATCTFRLKISESTEAPVFGFSRDNIDLPVGQLVDTNHYVFYFTEGTQPFTYNVEPELPPGLGLDGQSGSLLTGTPTQLQSNTTYTFTLSNAAGSYSQDLQIAIVESATAITSFNYDFPSVVHVGDVIHVEPQINTMDGVNFSFYSDGEPETIFFFQVGLDLDQNTGILEGTIPVWAAGFGGKVMFYASNSTSSMKTEFWITVE